MSGVWIQSLVREPRYHMVHGVSPWKIGIFYKFYKKYDKSKASKEIE